MLAFEIDSERFAERFLRLVANERMNFHDTVARCIQDEFAENIEYSDLSAFVKALQFDTIVDRFPSTPKSVRGAVLNSGYEVYSITIRLDLVSGVELSTSDIKLSGQLCFNERKHSWGPDEISLKYKKMKTRERYIIQFIDMKVSSEVFTVIEKKVGSRCDCSKEFIYPIAEGVWNWVQRFCCLICGNTYLCECFRVAIEKAAAQETIESNPEYRESICHLCTGNPSDLNFCHPMYGSAIRVNYGAYIKKFEYECDISPRLAENMVREIIGVPAIGEGWVNETRLYRIVKGLLPNAEVIREASPSWLGRQRLDIYIPELALAIEYQGEQHFKSIGFFGGDSALQKNKIRDQKKYKLCALNNIRIVYFSYNEKISEALVRKKIWDAVDESISSERFLYLSTKE